eukprot:scaffold17455_cov81-Isochrysis_galbana.AAC.1
MRAVQSSHSLARLRLGHKLHKRKPAAENRSRSSGLLASNGTLRTSSLLLALAAPPTGAGPAGRGSAPSAEPRLDSLSCTLCSSMRAPAIRRSASWAWATVPNSTKPYPIDSILSGCFGSRRVTTLAERTRQPLTENSCRSPSDVVLKLRFLTKSVRPSPSSSSSASAADGAPAPPPAVSPPPAAPAAAPLPHDTPELAPAAVSSSPTGAHSRNSGTPPAWLLPPPQTPPAPGRSLGREARSRPGRTSRRGRSAPAASPCRQCSSPEAAWPTAPRRPCCGPFCCHRPPAAPAPRPRCRTRIANPWFARSGASRPAPASPPARPPPRYPESRASPSRNVRPSLRPPHPTA